jgi:hypothetical protein
MTALAITLGAGLVAEYEFEITHATHRLCDLAERVVDDLIASGAFGHEGGGE